MAVQMSIDTAVQHCEVWNLVAGIWYITNVVGYSPHTSLPGRSSLVCWLASFTSVLAFLLGLVVVFMFTFVLAIDVNAG